MLVGSIARCQLYIYFKLTNIIGLEIRVTKLGHELGLREKKHFLKMSYHISGCISADKNSCRFLLHNRDKKITTTRQKKFGHSWLTFKFTVTRYFE